MLEISLKTDVTFNTGDRQAVTERALAKAEALVRHLKQYPDVTAVTMKNVCEIGDGKTVSTTTVILTQDESILRPPVMESLIGDETVKAVAGDLARAVESLVWPSQFPALKVSTMTAVLDLSAETIVVKCWARSSFGFNQMLLTLK